ncbi:FAD-dependent monooxygenase [Actinosynnema pretiosum]|uniref:Salicylate hydroxylase n=1 Tax=Actinosynnema pretiosum TaxID=42197 RepID=A0A290Z6K4_9PSEU|nr:FAD-dependent monooxygenase [Actinosynnema pretiosum]ATE54602.1 salicylate hydroxylase [Actinosynnema pretiosum]
MATFVIAGGGIGGLSAALAVARAGHEVLVLERAPAFTEIGAGIQLAPNAFHALDALGVGDGVRERAVLVDALRLLDGVTGDQLAALPLDEGYRARFGNPYAVVHRRDLHDPLLRACREHPRVRLRAGTAVTGYEQDSGGVRCALSGGGTVAADGLVGADGIRSAVRARLLGDGGPRVSGHTIFRTTVPLERVPPELRWNSVCLWAAPGWHFVHYPIASGDRLNLAIIRDDGAATAASGVPADRAEVLAGFPDLAPTARALLELGEDWRRWVLCDRDPAPRWHDGRVVLVGDAAHPMLQYAAQGACQALEDAVVLGGLLSGADGGAVAGRFARFTAERADRVARTQLVARWMGDRVFHAPPAERAALLDGLSAADLVEAVAWLHAERATAPAAPTAPAAAG